MCGISGFFTSFPLSEEEQRATIKMLLNTIRHRGPDDEGCWTDKTGKVCLGHRRLSIIDLVGGSQPMSTISGNTTITLNGEIYNYIEEKQRLMSNGYIFRTQSDTEVALVLYEEHGIQFFNHLRGMFAFGLWDEKNRQLILARDRVGKKPLYYAIVPQGLFFSSEIKSLKTLEFLDLGLDEEALNQYLTFGCISGERTIYKSIKELSPGHFLLFRSLSDYKFVEYWKPKWFPKRKLSFIQAVERTEELLKEAVKIRLRADVPVGVFLSGGIDSGLITAIAAKEAGHSLITISAGLEDKHFDERDLARQVASEYAMEHHELVIRPDINALLPEIADAYGEPFADSSAIPSYCIAQLARKNLKVVLNGDGGDELFCGYRKFVAARLFGLIPERLIGLSSSRLIRKMPVPNSFRSAYSFFHRFLSGLAVDTKDRYLKWSFNGFTDDEKRLFFKNSQFLPRTSDALRSKIESFGTCDEVDLFLMLGFKDFLPDDLLVKMDIATMAHGLEARSPFLDHILVEWAMKLPNDLKLKGFKTKAILRCLAKKYLPVEIIKAPKRGFEVPLFRWLCNDLKAIRDDIIFSRNTILSELFDLRYLEKLVYRKLPAEPAGWAKRVWIILMLGVWDYYCNS
ncbi:MAG: asparagine synthase (glutamine-hydrolyzing) [Deltaproteobacteria bacterium]|nr:asparagine synthase (glutamine-hydrolyzing) [Deltaproteobacteria bacterium]